MALLKAGLWGDQVDLSAFPLSADEWTRVYEMSRRQTVSGLCYDAICQLPDELLPPQEQLMKWLALAVGIERTNAKMERAMVSLVGKFRELGLHPVVQKGHAVARFYERPELRESGDIDLWFAESERGQLRDAAAKIGNRLSRRPDGSLTFQYGGFEVECHNTLVDLRHPYVRKAIDKLVESQGFATVELEHGDVTIPAPIVELLMVDAHIMKHSFGVGVGLRQICDYARAAKALQGRYDAGEFRRLCRELHIDNWTAMLNGFVTEYLGADPATLPDPGRESKVSPEKLMDIVKEGGNFGWYLPVRRRFMNRLVQRKMHTLYTFMKRIRFSSSLAPKEALWTTLKLLIGQIH